MRSSLRVHFILFFVMLIYGLTFTWAKDVMPYYLGSQAFVFSRIAGALILFWIFAPFEKKVFKSERLTKIDIKDHWKLFVASIFGVSFNMSMFFKGLEITTPINGSVLMLNTPVFVLIIARFMGTEVFTSKKLMGIFLAALGAGLLMLGKDIQFSNETLVGDILITVNAIFYAFYLVYVRKLLVKYTVVTVSKWTFLYGIIMIFPFAIEELSQIQFDKIIGFIWVEIVFIIVFTTFLAYLLNAWAIEKGGSVLVGSYIYLQPLLAGLIAVFLGSDTFTWIKVFSAITIFAGVFLTSDKQQEVVLKRLKRSKHK
jgi:drug/metabolite transporter (DMT)-like permease